MMKQGLNNLIKQIEIDTVKDKQGKLISGKILDRGIVSGCPNLSEMNVNQT